VTNAFSVDKNRIIFDPDFDNLKLTFDFRNCTSGEAQKGNICEVCPVGKYTFETAAKDCLECMKNAKCLGGSLIEVDKGFWRQFQNSS